MNDAEWEEAIDDLEFYNDWIDDQIVAEHYQEERMDEELEELYENLDFYSDWIDELEELVDERGHKIDELEESLGFYAGRIDELEEVIEAKDNKIASLEEEIEHQKKVILSLRNKNSQLVGDINELLDEKEDIAHGYTTA